VGALDCIQRDRLAERVESHFTSQLKLTWRASGY
jgi:hypothetical protein